MKSYISILVVSVITLLTSCGGGGNTQDTASTEEAQQQLWDEMMVIHDEIMPAMGDIFKYSKTLKTYLDSTEVADELKAEIETAIENLNQADDGMMDWMAELKTPKELADSLDQKAIMEYLKSETEKIKVVKQQMEESLEQGEKMVQKITPIEAEE